MGQKLNCFAEDKRIKLDELFFQQLQLRYVVNEGLGICWQVALSEKRCCENKLTSI